MDARPQATLIPSYEDLHPSTEWKEDERSQTLVIHLPGFKREQLKAQIDNFGNMKVSAERQIDASSNKWVRFRKIFRVPENCTLNDIRAKYDKEVLYVTLPKMTPRAVDKQDKKPSDEKAAPIAEAEEVKKKTDDKLDEKQKDKVSKDAEVDAKQKMPEKQESARTDSGKLTNGDKMKKKEDEYGESVDEPKKKTDELMPVAEKTQGQQGLFALRMKRPSKKVIKIAVAAVVVVATVVLAIHVYKITSQDNNGELGEDQLN